MTLILNKCHYIALSVLLLVGCSDKEFSSQDVSSISTPSPVPAPPPVQLTSLSFERDVNTTTNVDMVWVVDNSASMTEEIQIIRENLSSFLLSLEDRARLNFTLITSDRGSHGMRLSQWALDRGYRQISQRIESFDSITRFLEHAPSMIVSGSLRSNSKKIIVVASDDNSEVTSRSFFRIVQRFINLTQLKVFGFVGLDRATSPCIDRPGNQYIEMAQNTGGEAFNICESDWSPYFEKLVKNVGQLTKTEFTLPQIPKSDLKVFIDGVETLKYKLEKNILVINPENFSTNKQYKIDVTYLP